MGYTHYMSRRLDEIPLPLWHRFREEFMRIVEEHAVLVSDDAEAEAPAQETGKTPLSDFRFDDDLLRFDGECETLVIWRIEHAKSFGTKPPEHFSFCKTNRYPYDSIVVAALILLTHICDGEPVGFHWRSDGKKHEHAEGRALTGLKWPLGAAKEDRGS